MVRKVSASRNTGVDLLRIIAMILVFTHHFLGHGLVLEAVKPLSLNWYVFWLFKCLCYTSVTAFYLISAYYQSRKALGIHSIVKIWLQVQFYPVICYALSVVLQIVPFGFQSALKAFFPVIFRQYGFFNGSLLMAMLAPFLNKMFSAMTRKMNLAFIILLSVLCSVVPYIAFTDPFNMNYGEGTLWIILLYAIGYYLRQHITAGDYGLRKPAIIALVCVAITWISKVMIALITNAIVGEVKYSGAFVGETQIFILTASVCLFVFFLNLDDHMGGYSKSIIRIAAPLMFSVFLVTENNNLRGTIWSSLAPYRYANESIWKMFTCYVCALIFCFALPMLIEALRSMMERKCKISRRLARLLTENKIIKKTKNVIKDRIGNGE